MISCQVKTIDVRTPSIIVITTSEERKLKFEHSIRREKILLEKCPDKRVKELFKKAFEY